VLENNSPDAIRCDSKTVERCAKMIMFSALEEQTKKNGAYLLVLLLFVWSQTLECVCDKCGGGNVCEERALCFCGAYREMSV
jgi:hypothetical protein